MASVPQSRRGARVPRPPRPPRPPHVPRVLGRTAAIAASPLAAASREATGRDVVDIALKHLGEQYILGARAPMADASWQGPWDCAEFASWCVYQASGTLFGVEPDDDPVLADAYSGFWLDHGRAGGTLITIEDAAAIAGAIVLRAPRTGRTGHVVLSDGKGGTIEAHSAAKGVCLERLDARRWDHGILVPGIRYLRGEVAPGVLPAKSVLRVTEPLMSGPSVEKLQRRLADLGYFPGPPDGIYGPQTESAVQMFQAEAGLVPDGEFGEVTAKALAKAGK